MANKVKEKHINYKILQCLHLVIKSFTFEGVSSLIIAKKYGNILRTDALYQK